MAWPSVAASSHLGGRHGQAQPTQELGTKPFVLDGVGEVKAPTTDQPQGQLEDVCRWRGLQGAAPFPAHAQQRGFFLRASDGDAEVVRILLPAGPGVGDDPLEMLLDVRIAHWLAVDPVEAVGPGVGRQELDSTHTVAADGLKQLERLGRVGLEASRNPAADAVVVGQQVIELVLEKCARDRPVGRDGHGQRERPDPRRLQSGRLVRETVRAGSATLPGADALAVHPDPALVQLVSHDVSAY